MGLSRHNEALPVEDRDRRAVEPMSTNRLREKLAQIDSHLEKQRTIVRLEANTAPDRQQVAARRTLVRTTQHHATPGKTETGGVSREPLDQRFIAGAAEPGSFPVENGQAHEGPEPLQNLTEGCFACCRGKVPGISFAGECAAKSFAKLEDPFEIALDKRGRGLKLQRRVLRGDVPGLDDAEDQRGA